MADTASAVQQLMQQLKSMDSNADVMTRSSAEEVVKDYLWITLSAVFTAIAVNVFFQSTGLAPGGITGLAIIFSLITHIPVSYMSLMISIPLLILATILLGKGFGIKTLYITLITPVCMGLVPMVDLSALFSEMPWFIAPLIAAIAGGVLVGAAVGIALNRQCATGGTDVIALLIQYVFRFLKVPTILFCLDGSVVVASGIISGNAWIAGFSLFSLFIIMQTIRKVTAHKQPQEAH